MSTESLHNNGGHAIIKPNYEYIIILTETISATNLILIKYL